MMESVDSQMGEKTGYESPSWWYDLRGFFILKLAYRGSLIGQIQFFRRNLLLNQGGEHLEAAIGSGTLFSLVLLTLGRRGRQMIRKIVGFDYAEQMLSGARKRFGGRPEIELLAADVHSLPFADGHFQTVNVANAIHCFSKIEIALGELYRVLKPGGWLATNVLLEPRGFRVQRWVADKINRWGAQKGILYRAYREDEFLKQAEQAGFVIVHQDVRGNALFLVLQRP